MTKAIRNTFFSLRELLLSYGPYLFILAFLMVLSCWWMNPTPPKRVVLATGPAQSAYEVFGKKYAAWLKPYGIQVELRATEGSSANLELLRSGKVDLGFVQGGSGSPLATDEENLATLGSLFVEPIWVFYTEASSSKLLGAHRPLDSLTQLKGWRVNLDTEGSGVKSLMDKLFDINKLDPADLKISRMDVTPATVALLAGELDAIILVAAPESLIVQMLLQTPGVKLMNFAQNQTYARRLPFLSPITLPQGVVDLSNNIPSRDTLLAAATTSLVTQSGTHPALLHLFSMAAHNLHDQPGWFNKIHEFPNTKFDLLPIAPEADRYIKNGAPFLQRHLPFWAANLIDRMWVVMGILLAVALPISKILPPLYQYRIRRSMLNAYTALRLIEDQSDAIDPQDPKGKRHLITDLNHLEARVERISVPAAYANELYSLRSNIQLVRTKLLAA
jgi:TRAP-type uncharacterized transport system substrate-binding protein